MMSVFTDFFVNTDNNDSDVISERFFPYNATVVNKRSLTSSYKGEEKKQNLIGYYKEHNG